MKRIILSLLMMGAGYIGFTQVADTGGLTGSPREILATAVETTNGVLKVDKIERPALVAEYNIDHATMEDALKESFKQKGIKLERSKGLLVAKGVNIPEMDNNKYDVYFDIDRKSKSEKEVSIVKMAISSGYDNFISAAVPVQHEGAKKYTALSLSPSLHQFKLQNDIINQTKTFEKAEKKYNDLLKESEKLEKERKQLEKDTEENKKNQVDQLKEIARQKAEMEALKATVVK